MNLTKTKSLFFYLILVGIVVGTLELTSWIAYPLLYDTRFSRSDVVSQRNQVIEAPFTPLVLNQRQQLEVATRNSREAVHPFIGFVLDSEKMPGRDVNNYGFIGNLPPRAETPDHNEYTIAVLGGSFANGFATKSGGNTLVKRLRQSGVLGARKPVVVNLALPGMKQPQQLMILNYFLSLGFQLDMVLNIDGFNEIVLPVVDNNRVGTNVFYPRAWRYRVSGLLGPKELRTAGRLAIKERNRSRIAKAFSIEPLDRSITLNFLWTLIDDWAFRSIEQTRYQVTQNLLRSSGDERIVGSYTALGPKKEYRSDDEMYNDLSAYWIRSSELTGAVARANDIRYFHFLQPNQYVENSKIFTDEEREIALDGNPNYRQAATRGYPYLIEYGKALSNRGIAFTDLTKLFEENDEVLYADSCCHLNPTGYSMVAERIADVIVESME